MVTYKVPAVAPEGPLGLRYLIREAARQQGLPTAHVVFLDQIQARE